MVQIDNKKMWESLIREMLADEMGLADYFIIALRDQGLKWDDDAKEIVSIEPEPFVLEVGKWYECIKDFITGTTCRFREGSFYLCEIYGCLTDEQGFKYNSFGSDAAEYFRPATEEEINGKDGNIFPDWAFRKGKYYACIKDVIMDGNRFVSYFQGKLYKSEEDGCLTNELGNKLHTWNSEDKCREYFRPATPEEVLKVKHGIIGIGTKKAEGKLGELINERIATEEEVPHKFREGDWIVIDGETMQIESVGSKAYNIKDGGIIPFRLEHEIHLWTIADAKDGDVLTYNDGHGNDCIELIKSITDKKIEFWFCLTNGNYYEVFDGITPYTNLISRESATPATKEQRDALMKAMVDAGYTFDFEKKELKKIEHEQKPTQEIEPFEAEHGKFYYCIKDYFCGGRKRASKGDVVQALRGLPIMGLKDASEYFLPVNFIKCNSAWSEEDEITRMALINLVEMYYGGCINKSEKNRLLDWLKSLRPQNTWKPSDEQMEALEDAIRYGEEELIGILSLLYNDLKRLREE